MIPSALRWLGRSLGTLILAFILAVIVWVSAVTDGNPNEERDFPRLIPIEIIGQDANLLMIGSMPAQVRVRLDAPRSVWTQLTSESNALRAYVDLTGLAPGKYTVPVHVDIHPRPVRLEQLDPQEVEITLEALSTRTFPVTLLVDGTPSLGYAAGEASVDPGELTVSGPESLVSRVKELRATLNIANATNDVDLSLPLTALDAEGNVVNGLTINPKQTNIRLPIRLLGGYRNVIVKVITTGQVANGYKLTNIFVTPPNVIVFSTDPKLVDELPGYVETEPLNLTNASDDLETRLDLSLPRGVSVVGDSKVLVQVSVAAIESNLTVSLPVELTNLTPGLEAEVAPTTVDVILVGPVPVLDMLKPSDIRVSVDLSGYGEGTYRIIPIVELLPERVTVVSILPPTVDVTIKTLPTPTPTPTPRPTPTPSAALSTPGKPH